MSATRSHVTLTGLLLSLTVLAVPVRASEEAPAFAGLELVATGLDARASGTAPAARAGSVGDVHQGRRYELITPTGARVMAAALRWQVEQASPGNAASYAQPAQCARNVSRVFALAGLSHYSSPLIPDLIEKIRARGGFVRRLPKGRAGLLDTIRTAFGGRFPTGSVVAGLLNEDGSGAAGDGHVALVGDVDAAGAVLLYHNNWYRPDNEGGVWKEHMIPREWYDRGYRRKFMATPWLNVLRDPPRIGVPYDFSVVLPAIDDLDPTNYFVTVAVPAEIWAEYKSGCAKVLDGSGNQVPLSR